MSQCHNLKSNPQTHLKHIKICGTWHLFYQNYMELTMPLVASGGPENFCYNVSKYVEIEQIPVNLSKFCQVVSVIMFMEHDIHVDMFGLKQLYCQWIQWHGALVTWTVMMPDKRSGTCILCLTISISSWLVIINALHLSLKLPINHQSVHK